jgi:alkylation response protein AidB-like acyl-CoA dehydrogenase
VDFALSDEQQMLVAASRDLLSDRSGPLAARRALEDERAPDRLWSLGSELGWPGLALPEEHGGSGQGLVELALVATELGRAVARTPFVPTALVGAAVARGGDAGLQGEVLPLLAAGSATGSWALAEPGGAWNPASIHLRAAADGADVLISGRASLVQDADEARWLLVTAQLDGRPATFLVDADSPGVSARRQVVLDITRAFSSVTFDEVRVPNARRLDLDGEALRTLFDEAAVLTAADALGAGEQLLAMTVDYVKVRQQFGRPIGSFQAIKHKCATMRMQLLGCYSSVYYAAAALAAGSPDAAAAAAAAKAFAAEEMSDLAGESLQAHGGIGFTWEHDLHLYLRRIKVDALLYGDTSLHYERLTRLLEQEGSPAA